jgi:lysyl-tRNA synthetase class 1
VDQFLRDRTNFGKAEDETTRVNNPVFFVEQDKLDEGKAVAYNSDITYGLLLNLVSVLGTDDRAMVWEYIERYDPTAAQHNEAIINDMIDCALRYYKDFVAPSKSYEAVSEPMLPALQAFVAYLEDDTNDHSADAIQTACYEAGKTHELALKQWFKALYKMLIGQPQGPRIGTFVQLYGIDATLKLIETRQA